MQTKLKNALPLVCRKAVFVSLALLAAFVPSLQAQHNTKHVLHNGGGRSDAENVVFVILGDGYASNQQTAFLELAQKTCDAIINKRYPYTLFKDRINIYAIETHSTGEDGFLGFVKGGSLVFGTNDASKVATVIQQHAAKTAMTMIFANGNSGQAWGWAYESMKVPGTQSGWCVVGIGGDNETNIEKMMHETGHSLGILWDEYCAGTTGMQERANSSIDSNPNTNPWRAWLGIEDIGMYQQPNQCKTHVTPTVWLTAGRFGVCLMQGSGNNSPYCRVCSAELIRRMAKIIDEPYKANDDTLTSFDIPRGAKRIVNAAFNGCFNLESVIIPSSVQTIGDYAFLRDTSLKTISNFAAAPQEINSTVFYGINNLDKIVLRVPPTSVETYKATEIWKEFNVTALDENLIIYHQITITGAPNGKITIDGIAVVSDIPQTKNVADGGSLTVIFEPDAEYEIKQIYVNGRETIFYPTGGANNSATGESMEYTFDNVTGDSTIHVIFVPYGSSPIDKVKTAKTASISFAGIKNGQINVNLKAGDYTVELYNVQGRMLDRVNISAVNGLNATGLKTAGLSKGTFILNVKQAGVSVLKQKIRI
ncbi:MAG: leucine-rich repeat protein [Chitinispirillales bacterium]|nr:leucine-rich repeat protein [Chitinispirillales bacterium]